MKQALIFIAVALLCCSCASLDERLASPDVAVRNGAFQEFLSSEKLNNELVHRAIASVSDPGSLEKLATSAKTSSVRLAALSSVTNQAVVVSIANNDPDVNVRVAAIRRITDQSALGRIARNGTENDRKGRHTTDLEMSQIAALQNLTDDESILFVATNSPSANVRRAAMLKIPDEKTLAEIALCDPSIGVRNVAYSKISDANTIVSTAKDEPEADLALGLLKKLPNLRTYNQLKRELARADEIIDKSRMDENEGDFQLDQIAKEILKKIDLKFEYDSPLIKIMTYAELALVRKAAVEKIRAQPYVFRDFAEREIKRLLLSNGSSYKDRTFEWFDHCEPLDDEFLVSISHYAWPNNDFPSEIILWGMLADSVVSAGAPFGSYRTRGHLIARCRDRKLLEYLAKNSSCHWMVGVDASGYWRNNSKKVCIAGGFHDNNPKWDYEPKYKVNDPWGVVPGIVVYAKDYLASSKSFYCNKEAVKARLAVLDKETADEIAVREAEVAAKIKADRLAAIRTESSQAKLVQTAQSDTDADLRVAAIERLDDHEVLEDLATNDNKKEIRATAVMRLDGREILLDIIENDLDESVRDVAFARMCDKHPSQITIPFILQLHKTKKVSTATLSKGVSLFSDSPTLRRQVVESRWVASELRVAALIRVADSGYLATTAMQSDSSEVVKAAISRIDDDSTLICIANGDATVKDEEVRKFALERLKSLSRWETIASRLIDTGEQKAALEMLTSEGSMLKVVMDNHTPPLIVILASQRIKSNETLAQIADVLSIAESAWRTQLNDSLDDIQQNLASARIHLTSRTEFESDFKSRVGSSEIEVMGSQLELGAWCVRWKNRLTSDLAELDRIEKSIDNLDIPEASCFDEARTRCAELRVKLQPLKAEQRKMLGEIEDWEKIHKQALEMFGPSIIFGP